MTMEKLDKYLDLMVRVLQLLIQMITALEKWVEEAKNK